MEHLHRRTLELQRSCRAGAEVHVLPGTVHWSFVDYFAVAPAFVGRLLGLGDAAAAHRTTVGLVGDFLERVCA